MVNFRYHVVSLVAVFLALALGIVMGTTVISENLVNQLRRDSRDFGDRNQQLRAQVDGLEGDVGFYERFGEGVVPAIVSKRMAGKPVVLLVQDGAADTVVDHVTLALRMAGAAKPAVIRTTKSWALSQEADRDRLGLALSETTREIGDLTRRAAQTLGGRLVASDDSRRESDTLRRLAGAGFLKLDDLPAGPFPVAGSSIVFIPSGVESPVPSFEDFVLPLARALNGRRPTVVAEGRKTLESAATRIRGDADVNGAVGTIDHADTAAGQIGLIWALQAALAARPALHLGVADGATGIMPLDLTKP